MITKEMAASINAQINREFFSAYYYLGLSAKAEEANLKAPPHGFWPSTAKKWDMRSRCITI